MSLAVEAEAPVVSVEADGLAHHYAPGRGLDPVSFSIHSPGAVAVVGANGSGKSTLIRILAGLLRPSRGALALRLDGTAAPPIRRRESVGYAAPDLAFYEEFTVEENLKFAAEARALAGGVARIDEVLRDVGLDVRAADRVSALSSGMKQRLRLAFALLHRPPMLLLDEPGSHLDDEGRSMVARIVDRHRRTGLVLLATNDEREWALVEQRIELRGRGLGRPA